MNLLPTTEQQTEQQAQSARVMRNRLQEQWDAEDAFIQMLGRMDITTDQQRRIIRAFRRTLKAWDNR